MLVGVGLSISCKNEAVPVSEPFSIANRPGSWSSLNAAIAAAEPGDTVVIDQDGEVPYSPFVISVPLRLQAAPERKPLFVSTADNASFIRAEAPVVFEGLTFMQHIVERKRCPSLIEARSSLAVMNCRLGRVWKGKERLLDQSPVIQYMGSDLVIENSELYAPSSVLLLVGGNEKVEQRLRLKNNVLTAAFVIAWTNGRSLLERKVEVAENNVLGGAFFSVDESNNVLIRVEAERNVFDVHTLLGGGMHWEQFKVRLPTIEWVGRENLFACKYYLTSFWGGQPDEAYETDVLEEWQALASVEEDLAADEDRAIASDWLPKDYVMDPIRLEVEGNLETRVLELDPLMKTRYTERGIDSALVGPGRPWDAWRGSEDFAMWDARAKAALVGELP